jgi:hypothetical protein
MSGASRLLDQVRDVIRIKHYSIRTEQAYLQWIRRYILFHDKRHPSELGSEHLSTSSATSPSAATWLHPHRTRR